MRSVSFTWAAIVVAKMRDQFGYFALELVAGFLRRAALQCPLVNQLGKPIAARRHCRILTSDRIGYQGWTCREMVWLLDRALASCKPLYSFESFCPGLNGWPIFREVCRDRIREFAFAPKDWFPVLSRKIVRVLLSRPSRPLIGNEFGPFGIKRWPVSLPSTFYDLLKFGEDWNSRGDPLRLCWTCPSHG